MNKTSTIMHRSLVRYCLPLCLFAGLFFCADNLKPLEQRLAVSITASDTSVVIHDPFVIRFSVSYIIKSEVKYIWYVDSPLESYTTVDSVVVRRFRVGDTGRRCIVVRAEDSRGSVSPPETLAVSVGYRRPGVRIIGATTAYANAPYAFILRGTAAAVPVDRFDWYADREQYRVATLDSIVPVSWRIADTGTHRIVARAIDDDGIASLPETLSVRVGYLRPVLQPFRDTAVKVNTSLTVRFRATDPVSKVDRYRYQIDNSDSVVVTADSAAVIPFRVADTGMRRLVARAINVDGIESLPETLSIAVTCSRPLAALSADTTVALFDTVAFVALATDADGRVEKYLWSIDFGQWIATDTAVLHWAFGAAGDLRHTVRLVSVDNDGLSSDTARIRIGVSPYAPVVRILGPSDTVVYANSWLVIHAQAYDTNGAVTAYRWTADGRLFGQSLQNDSIRVQWGVADAGVHLVAITVLDDDFLESARDTMRVRVLPGTPLVAAMRDTAVSSNDTVTVTCAATDPNGSVVRYLWNTGGNGWNDSSATPAFRLAYDGRGSVRVIAGARDNDGLTGTDTVTVNFNRPPSPISVARPLTTDTISFFQSAARCTVSFSWSAPDPDNDAVTSVLSFGPAPDSLVERYRGSQSVAAIVATKPGRYFWRLSVQDSWGHLRVASGTVVVLREYRICFAGHSVVAGAGGSDSLGGFRRGVIDSLRTMLGAYDRLKVVGPYRTWNLRNPSVDDSCMAISGTTAREIFLMLAYDHPGLCADIWVLMIGVNDNYSWSEQTYTTRIMDNMVGRNPQSRLYVLNGYLLPETSYLANYYRYYYNAGIADTVADRNAKGAHMSLVNAYSALTTPDSLFDTTLTADGLHPNQAGYDRLRDSVLAAMRSSDPPALPVNPDTRERFFITDKLDYKKD